MGAGSSGQSAFQIDTTGAVKATNISVQSATTSNGRIEITAGNSWSQINFYYGGTRRGYIYGGTNGLEIWGSPAYIGGSSMTIASNTLYLQSNRTCFRPGSLYVSNGGSDYYPGITGLYQVLSLKTKHAVGFALNKVYYNMQFYNGILVDAPTGEETEEES